jgi:hypothetical protein
LRNRKKPEDPKRQPVGIPRRGAGELSKPTALRALKLPDQKLAQRGKQLDLILIGGGAMMLYGARDATRDLDVIPRPASSTTVDLVTMRSSIFAG